MAGSFPPSSKWILVSESAADRMMSLAVAPPPVNEILRTSRCATRAEPTSPSPCTTLMTPGGKKLASRLRMSDTVSGAKGDGLTMTVLPATRAWPIFCAVKTTGAFHGTMHPTTPNGRRRTRTQLSGSVKSSPSPSSSMPAAAATRRIVAAERISRLEIGRTDPFSRVRRIANCSWSSSSSLAARNNSAARSSTGSACQAVWARAAMPTTRSTSDAEAVPTVPTMSLRRPGSTTSNDPA